MILNIRNLEKKLKINLKNKSLLVEALTHKSSNHAINNEKLEFLGDRVIALILSKKLIDLYPNKAEGILDKRFAKLVNRKTCATIAWSIGLNNFIVLGDSKKKITKKDEKILSDACEAVMGAIYIDQGFDNTKDIVINLWKKQILESDVTVLDPKTELQEYSLKLYKKLPIYKLISTKGPRHNPLFKISVSINSYKDFLGSGNSKQEAQQSAAKNLLKSINTN